MSLINRQAIFARNFALLLTFAEQLFTVTLGEGERTLEQHKLNLKKGTSKAKLSKHCDRLAHDLYFYEFVNKQFVEVTAHERLKTIGEYWKTLDPKNRWGGDWTDPYDPWHFEGGY